MKKLSLIKYMAGLLMVSGAAAAADLGNGFIDHGVCSPVSSNKGATVATDADGNDMLVCILADYRGRQRHLYGYSGRRGNRSSSRCRSRRMLPMRCFRRFTAAATATTAFTAAA